MPTEPDNERKRQTKALVIGCIIPAIIVFVFWLIVPYKQEGCLVIGFLALASSPIWLGPMIASIKTVLKG